MKFRPKLIDKNNRKNSFNFKPNLDSSIKLSNATDNFAQSVNNTHADVGILTNSMKSIKIESIKFTNFLPNSKLEFIGTKKHESVINFLKNPTLINNYSKAIDFTRPNGKRLKNILLKYFSEEFIDSHTEVIREADVNFSKFSIGREDFRVFVVYVFENIADDTEKQWFIVMFFDPYHLVFPKDGYLDKNYKDRSNYDKSFYEYFNNQLGNIKILDLNNFE